MWNVKAVAVPSADFLASRRSKHSFRDALSAPLSNTSISASQAQLAIFSHMPHWVNKLMALRNKIVGLFGFEVATDATLHTAQADLKLGDRAGFMKVIAVNKQEVISFAEDKHMSFYICVSIQNANVVVSTMVNLKTTIGKIYMTIIKPFHWVIARVVINNAVKNQRL